VDDAPSKANEHAWARWDGPALIQRAQLLTQVGGGCRSV